MSEYHKNIDIVNGTRRSDIYDLEAFGKSLPSLPLDEARKTDFAQVELRVEHNFSLGIYARTLYIPKGAVVVGKLHKFPQLNIMVQGDISVSVGDEIKRLNGFQIINSPAGVKRVAFAHEDTIWVTVHGTHETNLDKIEEHFIAQSEDDYLKFIANQEKQLCLTI